MKYVYILVYAYDFKTVSDFIFFNSPEEAIDWKKKQIEEGICANPISHYNVRGLESL